MIAYLSIRSRGGKLILRNEDLDHPKNKEGAAQQAIDDLRFLGFDWDEGPDIGGPNGPYTQSERKEYYREALNTLRDKGLVYPCTCTRKDVEAGQSAPHEGEMLHYPGLCRNRYTSYEAAEQSAHGRLPAWRFNTASFETVSFNDLFAGPYTQNVAEYCGDFVLAREKYGAGYMLAVVVDDHMQGITEVIRGDDLLSATPAQLLIYKSLGYTPPDFVHVPLVVGPDGKRLAKRHGDTRINSYREAGMPKEKIIGMLAASLGLIDEGEEATLQDLIPIFNLSKIPHKPLVIMRN